MYIPLDWIISGIILLIIIFGLNKKNNINKEED